MIHMVVRHFLFLILVSFTFFVLPIPITASAQGDPQLQAPGTIEEAKEGILNIGDTIMEAIPRVIANIWNTQVTPVWKRMGEWAQKEVLEKRVLPALKKVTDKAKTLIGQKVEERKPIIEQELEKEKQELKKDIQEEGEKAKHGLWERFKALFR